tara:strand:- start:158 stop:613 length:456 start_codon:yes stop_codon:yes gene_type:complete
MSLHVLAICLAVLEVANPAKPHDQALSVCYQVGEAAERAGLPPELAVALAYTESRLNPAAESSAGALGPLQVIPRWHCPGGRARGCDLIDAGILALLKFERKFGPSWDDVLCHWTQGNKCWSVGRRFARIVLERAEKFRHGGMCMESAWLL